MPGGPLGFRRLIRVGILQNRSEKLYGKATGPHNKKVYETECYRCGMKGHWSRTCRTTKHLVDLYQASMKEKDKQIEKKNLLTEKTLWILMILSLMMMV